MGNNEPIDGRAAKGLETRQKILAGALEVLTEQGPDGFTAGLVAKAAGVSKASLFHHFKKVDDVAYELLDQMLSAFDHMRLDEKSRTVGGYVLSIGKPVSQLTRQQRRISAVFLQFYLRSIYDETYRLRQEQGINTVVKHIEDGLLRLTQKKLSTKKIETAALLIAMTLEGMGLFGQIIDDQPRLLSAWTMFSKLINQLFELEDADANKM